MKLCAVLAHRDPEGAVALQRRRNPCCAVPGEAQVPAGLAHCGASSVCRQQFLLQPGAARHKARNPLQPTQREGRLKTPPNGNEEGPGQGRFARETAQKPRTG
eukprot:1720302-Rhodomonas_salina.1